jgi:hypothetical protein
LNGTLDQQGRSKILVTSNITAMQIGESLLAIPAFLPATVCTGYVVGWFTNLHDFRQRSLVERIFWSLPLSVAISTISSVLIARFLSLFWVVALYMAFTAVWIGTLSWEWLRRRRTNQKWNIGWHPLGGRALALAILWIAVTILSLVDFQGDERLFMSLATFDHGQRVNWTESIIRTGVPPANPYYFYKQASAMRYYYFWFVVCAAIASISHLAVRAVLISSCVWAGFCFSALSGLYLKHFLQVGNRLREQFLVCATLPMVTGLYICINVLVILTHRMPAPGYLEVWPPGEITSWLDSLFWVPHHVVSMVCCMFAFLLAWNAGADDKREHALNIPLIALALASAFGLSIYVAFAFFLLSIVWALWQVAIERNARPALLLATGGAGSVILLLPYLWELAHTASKMQGGSLFAFTIRETIPPDYLWSFPLFEHLRSLHPLVTPNLAKLILLAPGYAIELGFFFVVFLIYLISAWRGRTPLDPARRSLLLLIGSTLMIISFIRSGVLESNDFGWRGALLLQFPLLLLGSELLMAWKLADKKHVTPTRSMRFLPATPYWIRSIASLALVFGVFSTLYQVLILRFTLNFFEDRKHTVHDPKVRSLAHMAFISNAGYSQLNAVIPQNAIVQFNPANLTIDWSIANIINTNHQAALVSDELWCGAQFGGDPSGCPSMAGAIDALFNGASPEQARATCHQYGIQYLVANFYDPVWKDKSSWVWTLKPVISDDEFRALDCRD